MKKIFFSLFLLLNINAFSQDLKDRIYPKNGDSIVCKITSATANWITYNHERKNKIRSNSIHMDDIKYYIHRGVKRKPFKKQHTLVPFLKKMLILSEDTLNTYYLDNRNNNIHARLY